MQYITYNIDILIKHLQPQWEMPSTFLNVRNCGMKILNIPIETVLIFWLKYK